MSDCHSYDFGAASWTLEPFRLPVATHRTSLARLENGTLVWNLIKVEVKTYCYTETLLEDYLIKFSGNPTKMLFLGHLWWLWQRDSGQPPGWQNDVEWTKFARGCQGKIYFNFATKC